MPAPCAGTHIFLLAFFLSSFVAPFSHRRQARLQKEKCMKIGFYGRKMALFIIVIRRC